MSVEIRDNRINLDRLISDLSKVSGKAEIVGVITDDEKLRIIAGANEFGAEIHSPKALKYMRVLAGKNKVKLTGDGKGFIRIPERSFLRSSADDIQNQDGITETIRFYTFRALAGISTFDEVLSRAGNYLAKKIQARIASQIPPKNHPLTEAVKGHDKTLIGTTRKLIASIDHKTVGRNEV